MQRILVFFFLLTLFSVEAAHAITFVFINNNPVSQSEHFVSSTPIDRQVLDVAPDAVVITFSLPVNPDRSSIKVYDMYSSQQSDGTVTVNGAAMSADLPPLPSGKYAVKWKTRCLCDDTTDLNGEFHFTVR